MLAAGASRSRKAVLCWRDGSTRTCQPLFVSKKWDHPSRAHLARQFVISVSLFWQKARGDCPQKLLTDNVFWGE